MYTTETQVKVLTLKPDDGKFLTNYPTADIKDAQVSTTVFVREDLSGPWREIDEDEAKEILKMKEEALKVEQEKEQEKEQEDANI